MATTRSRSGASGRSERKHVGLTVPRETKVRMLARAAALEWSVGDWVLAAAAEHGQPLRDTLGDLQVRKRPAIEDAAFTALYLTSDEREELDETARDCGLNRSAFVTAVSRLAMGDELDEVVVPLQASAGGRAPATDHGTTASSDGPARR